MTCEVCGHLLPDDYLWRTKCVGCGYLHTLCVDCGCRHARRTGLQPDDTWAELDGCPDEVAVAAAVAGDVGEGVEQAVWRVMRQFMWEAADDRTARRVLDCALREAGLPCDRALTDPSRPGEVGLQLADGREVWSS